MLVTCFLTPVLLPAEGSGLPSLLQSRLNAARILQGMKVRCYLCCYLSCLKVLLPAEGSGLPSLLQSRLNAPRILQVMKVRRYICCYLFV